MSSSSIEEDDPDVIRGIERVTGETYDRETGIWHRGGVVQQPGGGDTVPVTGMPGEHLYGQDGKRIP